MAHVWIQDKDRQWVARPLEGEELNLGSFLVSATGDNLPETATPAGALLVRTGAEGAAEWAILSGQESGIAVNGMPLLLGIRVLADRDDIRWSALGCAFYSTEEPAAVASLPQSDRKLFCPRCKQEIAPGTPAVRCPRCGIWHHQSEQLPCYTYADRCATCTRKASLESDYDWTPEEM